jgi:type III pantothenate kinase
MAHRRVLVDIGNSRVKWGRAEGAALLPGAAFPTDTAALGTRLDPLWGGLEPPDAVYVSNVAGAEIAAELSAWVDSAWGVPVRFAKAEAAACGVVNGYEQPSQLGVDRWVGLIALKRYYALPTCLVDCGTALTLDVLDAEGVHLGGLIAPGPALMKRALLRGTRGIAHLEGEGGAGLGRNTAAGVAGGVLHAAAGLVEKALRETAERLGRVPSLVLTGGDGEALGRCLAVPYRFDADLILKGLLTLAENDS